MQALHVRMLGTVMLQHFIEHPLAGRILESWLNIDKVVVLVY